MELNRRRYLATIGATVSGLALAGCSESESGDFEDGNGGGTSTSGDSGSNGNSGDGSSKDVELLNHEMVRENEGEMSETVKVVGEAENVSGGELSYAEVEVKFYEGDTLAESFMDNINGWSAGETWAFEVQYPGIGEDAAVIDDYEIRAGTSL
ncbi:hypothetical protein SAMN05216388_100217 [Halorientalis persicus]|uniref:Tat (Twin-arginine translocation) pathway signal sequence n=1 Tax=Halorientalis persicus TaxID=1367881 RepID=A0A1H8EI38_9EURY|nr:FxLYD domain-containing protein [Halorientalis persicus]SEN19050.1 hypothetical protein SAMN05216388_100217 [Halorientalis persicus]